MNLNSLKNRIIESPRKFLRIFNTELQKGKDNPVKMAASIGLGLFFGIVPIWGFQMLAAFTIASLLKLNRIVVLLGTNISFPIFIPFVIFISFEFGALFVNDPVQLTSFKNLTTETIYLQLHQYIIGSVILAIIVGLIGAFLTYFLMKKGISSSRIN
jgi:uncharacterized protein (DUF2062 family)